MNTTKGNGSQMRAGHRASWAGSPRYGGDTNTCAGYSLMEMLVFIALFAVIVNICAGTLVTTSRLSALTTLALDRVNGVAELEAGFRTAVQSSGGVIPSVGAYTSGEQQVVLRLAPQEGQAAYRVYGLLRDESRLSRMDLVQRGDVLETTYLKTFPQRVKHVALHWGADAEPVRLEYEILEEAGERPGQARVFSTAATPRITGGGAG